MTSDERKLIEGFSFLVTRSGRMVGEATKLIDYEGDVRNVPIDNLQENIEETKDLLDGLSESLEEARPES